MTLLWTKWFFPDWSNDPGLRASSLAARGLWMDMLCIAALHDPPGFIAINGNGIDVGTLARMVGASAQTVEPLIAELEGNGVFSRDRNGVIYSRRMVRDVKRLKTAQKQGRAGGNPDIRRGSVPKAQRVRPFKRSDSPAKTRRIWEKGGGKCHWCGAALRWGGAPGRDLFHVDHIVAVCDGGTNDDDNLVSACSFCNHARARKDYQNMADTNPDRNADTNPHTNPHKPRSQESRSQKERDLSLSGEARSRTRDGPRGSLASAARRMAEMVDDDSARTPAAQIGRKSR